MARQEFIANGLLLLLKSIFGNSVTPSIDCGNNVFPELPVFFLSTGLFQGIARDVLDPVCPTHWCSSTAVIPFYFRSDHQFLQARFIPTGDAAKKTLESSAYERT